ncbi:MAG TPA: AsmA-like C-terminal region-containing protein [Candidatus Krumholzibacteria bacterium]|nr:AsmA-like C-terminal region-containing protein [Candidatus Krumholzibacteria bacterium]HRX50108.1 AsmA-like C-terminal region-containing protein [Candidatus Krumholzibacteria bacterium]
MRRFLLRGVLPLVLIVAAAVVALKVLLPTDRLAALAAERLRAETGAEVAYGSVSLDVWPRVALSVHDVEVRSPSLDPGPAGGLVAWRLQAREIRGGLALGPLLARRAELDRVRLVQPMLQMTTRPAAVSADPAAPAPARREQAPLALVAAGATVEDGVLEWTQEGGRRLRLESWDQEVEASELGRLATLLAAWTGSGPPAAGDAPGALTLDGRVGVLTLEGFQPGPPMVLRDLTLSGRVEVPPAGPELLLRDLDAAWGGLRLTGEGTATAPGPDGRLHVDWTLTEHDAAALQLALAPLLPPAQAAAAAWLATTPVALPELVASGALDLPLPPPAGGAAPVLAGLTAEAALRGARVLPPRLDEPWTVDADLVLDDAQLHVRGVDARVDDGRLTGEMTVGHVDRPQPHASVDAAFDGLPAALVLTALAPSAAPYLEGAASGGVHGRFRLGDAQAVRASLSLSGEAVLTDGVVHASEWLEDVSRYLGDRQDLKDIVYGSLRHRLEVADGRYIVRDLELHGRDTDWSGAGWLGLDGTIDLTLRAKLPPGFTPDLGAMSLLAEGLRDADGRIVLDLSLTGLARRPAVGLDLGNAGAMLQKSTQNALEGEQGQALLKGVQGLLDKLRTRR